MKIYQMKNWIDDQMKYRMTLLLGLIFILTACSEKSMLRRYYVLEFPVPADTLQEDSRQLKGVCEILRVNVPPAYGQHRIAVRKQSHEIRYYQYHYWAVDPAQNLTVLLDDKIRQQRLFEHSASGNLKKVPNYQISTNVFKLEALDDDDNFYAHLQMKITLFDYASQTDLVSHQFDRTEELEERDLNLLASALSRIYLQEIDQFTVKIRTYFSKDERSTPAN